MKSNQYFLLSKLVTRNYNSEQEEKQEKEAEDDDDEIEGYSENVCHSCERYFPPEHDKIEGNEMYARQLLWCGHDNWCFNCLLLECHDIEAEKITSSCPKCGHIAVLIKDFGLFY